MTISGVTRIEEKEFEKISKYKDLQIEIEWLWRKKAKVVPIVIGTFGAIPKNLESHLNSIGVDKIAVYQLQKAALLGTAHILRKYLWYLRSLGRAQYYRSLPAIKLDGLSIHTCVTIITTIIIRFYFLPAPPLGSRRGTANIKHIKLIKNIVCIIKTSLKHPKSILPEELSLHCSF